MFNFRTITTAIEQEKKYFLTEQRQIFYDESGVCGMRYNNVNYEFVRNVLGDVIAIYKDDTCVAKYGYDAFGKCYITYSTDLIASINALRYRGYYYDTETDLYFLQTRYYDPEIGQFISPDTPNYLDPKTIGGVNLYAYCNNNPVMYSDPTGHAILTTLAIMGIGALIGAATSALASIITQAQFNDGEVNWKSVIVDAVTGAVSGALSASPLSVGWLMFAGAVVEGVSYIVDCAVNEEEITSLGFVSSVVSGIVFAKIGGNGANYKFALSNVHEETQKAINRERRRANQRYALKTIARVSKERKDIYLYELLKFTASSYGWTRVSMILDNIFG